MDESPAKPNTITVVTTSDGEYDFVNPVDMRDYNGTIDLAVVTAFAFYENFGQPINPSEFETFIEKIRNVIKLGNNIIILSTIRGLTGAGHYVKFSNN